MKHKRKCIRKRQDNKNYSNASTKRFNWIS